MKKIVLICMLAMLGLTQGKAQSEVESFGLFDHVGGGISLGTDGIGFDVAAPINDYFGVRMGLSFLPKITYGFDMDIDSSSSSFSSKKVKGEGKLNMVDFKLLFDAYPFKNSSFHVTVGAFIGSSKVVSIYNTEPFLNPSEWGTAGIKIGDYRISSDENGNVSADIKVNSFKPYLGVGFGRAVPKGRIGFSFDLGVQFWGTPGVYALARDDFGNLSYQKLKKGDIKNDDTDKFFDIMSKIVVYPVLSFRLSGRFL